MENFKTLYAKLLSSKKCRLHFSSHTEFCSFRNSFAVYIFRQKQVFVSLGADDDSIKCGLRTKYDPDTHTAEFFLAKKVYKEFEVEEVIEEVDNPTRNEEIRSNLANNQS